MLLQQLINSQQQAYANIQQQIEYLQEQQRQIQAHLQQLGSVESQMLSALQLVQEAVSSINQHCPDELDNYRQLVVGLFGAAPVAQLEAGIDDINVEESDNLDIEVVDSEETETTTDEADVVEEVQSPEKEYLASIKEVVALMSYRQIKQILADYKLDLKGKATVLKKRFIDYCERRTEAQHQAIWQYLAKMSPNASKAA